MYSNKSIYIHRETLLPLLPTAFLHTEVTMESFLWESSTLACQEQRCKQVLGLLGVHIVGVLSMAAVRRSKALLSGERP